MQTPSECTLGPLWSSLTGSGRRSLRPPQGRRKPQAGWSLLFPNRGPRKVLSCRGEGNGGRKNGKKGERDSIMCEWKGVWFVFPLAAPAVWETGRDRERGQRCRCVQSPHRQQLRTRHLLLSLNFSSIWGWNGKRAHFSEAISHHFTGAQKPLQWWCHEKKKKKRTSAHTHTHRHYLQWLKKQNKAWLEQQSNGWCGMFRCYIRWDSLKLWVWMCISFLWQILLLTSVEMKPDCQWH